MIISTFVIRKTFVIRVYTVNLYETRKNLKKCNILLSLAFTRNFFKIRYVALTTKHVTKITQLG